MRSGAAGDAMTQAFQHPLLRRFIGPDLSTLRIGKDKQLGSFGYDAWGYHAESVRWGLAVVRQLYERYFRVQAFGLERVPEQGRVLIVANHSGQLPFDGLLLGYALQTNPHAPRSARALVERFFPTVPWLGNLLARVGAVIGDPANCARMLRQEEAVIVFPEGARGAGKPYRSRYQLQRFGTGFMHLAMECDTPILPVGIVGCEESMPSLGNIAPLARMLSVPYIPIAPPFPLPARVSLHIGAPMRFSADAQDDEAAVEARVEQVKSAIRDLVAQGLDARGDRMF